ncbi:MAG: hypothetical protein HKL83_04500 [Acidimicrobiaceae bacterium]|nr:hypothetical protein [Acidimicrobiaceae bacterium]
MTKTRRSLVGMLIKPTGRDANDNPVAGAVTGVTDGIASAVEILGVPFILLGIGYYLSSHFHSPWYVVILGALGIIGTAVKYYYVFVDLSKKAEYPIRKKEDLPPGAGIGGLLGGDLTIPEDIEGSAKILGKDQGDK